MLDKLIAAHKQAISELLIAKDIWSELQSEYEQQVTSDLVVPCFIGGYFTQELSPLEMKQLLNERYDKAMVGIVYLNKVAPELYEEANKILLIKREENLALVDKIFEEAEAKREDLGLVKAELLFFEAQDKEEIKARAICSYKCQSVDEYEIRAKYLLDCDMKVRRLDRRLSLDQEAFNSLTNYSMALLYAEANINNPLTNIVPVTNMLQ